MYTQITFNPDLTDQEMTITIDPNGDSIQINLRLQYFRKSDKWYLSGFSPETGEPYFLFIPLIASGSKTGIGYDLTDVFGYKKIGCFWCVPLQSNPSSENPKKDNLEEFAIDWSDNYD